MSMTWGGHPSASVLCERCGQRYVYTGTHNCVPRYKNTDERIAEALERIAAALEADDE